MLLLSMVFPSFPVEPVVVLKNRIPAPESVEEPRRLQFLTELVVASLMNRMVEVPAVAEVLVLLMVRSFPATGRPFIYSLPSMVTLSAPFRSIKGAERLPLMLSPDETG